MKQPFQLKIKQNERLLTNIAQNLHIARQTGRQTDRQTDRQTERQRQGEPLFWYCKMLCFYLKITFCENETCQKYS